MINMHICLVSFKLVSHHGYNIFGLILFANFYTELSNFRGIGKKHRLYA